MMSRGSSTGDNPETVREEYNEVQQTNTAELVVAQEIIEVDEESAAAGQPPSTSLESAVQKTDAMPTITTTVNFEETCNAIHGK